MLPLAWVVLTLTFDGAGIVRGVSRAGLSPSLFAVYGQDYLPSLVVLATVLLGWRRLALAAIAAAVILGPGHDLLHSAFLPGEGAFLAVLGITALALVAVPGHARDRLLARYCELTVAVAVAAGIAERKLEVLAYSYTASPRHRAPWGWPGAEVACLGLVAAITVVLLVRSPASRRLLILLAVPLYFWVVLIVSPAYPPGSPLIYLPLEALAGAAALLAARRIRASQRPAAAGGST
jgi:hypothetical protein